MSKFCQYCGAELGMFEKKCPDCGAAYEECAHCEETDSYNDTRYYRDSSGYGSRYSQPMHNSPQHRASPNSINNRYARPEYNRQYGYSNTATNQRKRNAKVISVILLFFTVIFTTLVIAFLVVRNTGYRGVLSNYFDSFENNGGAAYIEAQLTSEMLYEMYGYDSDEIEQLGDMYSSYLAFYQISFSEIFGDDYKISYRITNKEELDEDDISEYNFLLSYITDNLEAEEGYNLELEIKIKGDGEKETVDALAQMLKINGAWIISTLETDGYGEFEIKSQIDYAYATRFDEVNSYARVLYKAAEDYASYCLSNGYRIPAGTVIGGEEISDGVAVSVSLTGDVIAQLNDIPTAEDIENGIDTCLPDGMVGMVYCIEFDETGFPCAVICAEDKYDSLVGAYPCEATHAGTTLSEAQLG